MEQKNSEIYHSYLLGVIEKELNSVIYDMGTQYDRILEGLNTAHLVSEHFDLDDKEISFDVFVFMAATGLIDEDDHYLADDGKAYFETLFVHADMVQATKHISLLLSDNPVVNLIRQVFYGRGKIGVEQLRILFNYHRIADREVEYSEVVSLLTFLNRMGIVTYDKKNKGFVVDEYDSHEKALKQYYIAPSTPFSNIYNLRKVFRTLRGNIYWIDKHFRKEGLEIILDGLSATGVQSITIISTSENVKQSAKDDFKRLRQELAERAIKLSWRILDNPSFKWHDRWLLSKDICYNIPPVLAIIRGQRADILKRPESLDVTLFLDGSIPLIEET